MKETGIKTFLIYGVSRGLGKALAMALPGEHDIVFGVSRTRPGFLQKNKNIEWIAADLSDPAGSSAAVKKHIGHQTIDCLIYNVGNWEEDGFTEGYNFKTNPKEEILNLVSSNISSCILAIQSLIGNLEKSANAKIILVGSTWALDNHNGKEVTFSATKFALKGITHAVRENLRHSRIGVSIINPGTLATEYDVGESTESIMKKTKGRSIPMQDVIQAVKFILATTNASCVKEINMPAMMDENV